MHESSPPKWGITSIHNSSQQPPDLALASAPETVLTKAEPRRWLSLGVAVLGLIILSPLIFVVAFLVLVSSPGPVLFQQTRIGLDRRVNEQNKSNRRRRFDCGGQPFRILKFRTMHVDDESDMKAIWATPHDHRITPIGRILRRLRVDELPQLINVLTGDMNVVGPRPEQPKIFSELREVIPGYALRQSVRPGITGVAQLNQGYDQSLDDVRAKVRWDLQYIENQSTWHDIKIMLQTIPFLFHRRGH